MFPLFIQRIFSVFLFHINRFGISLRSISLVMALLVFVRLNAVPLVSSFPVYLIRIAAKKYLCTRIFGSALGLDCPMALRSLASAAVTSIRLRVKFIESFFCFAKGIYSGSGGLIEKDVLTANIDFLSLRLSRKHDPQKPFAETKTLWFVEDYLIGGCVILLTVIVIWARAVIGAGGTIAQNVPVGFLFQTSFTA